jgi:hypothetical protein
LASSLAASGPSNGRSSGRDAYRRHRRVPAPAVQSGGTADCRRADGASVDGCQKSPPASQHRREFSRFPIVEPGFPTRSGSNGKGNGVRRSGDSCPRSGAPAPTSGHYEELKVFGTPTGTVAHAEEGSKLAASPRGFSWWRIQTAPTTQPSDLPSSSCWVVGYPRESWDADAARAVITTSPRQDGRRWQRKPGRSQFARVTQRGKRECWRSRTAMTGSTKGLRIWRVDVREGANRHLAEPKLEACLSGKRADGIRRRTAVCTVVGSIQRDTHGGPGPKRRRDNRCDHR